MTDEATSLTAHAESYAAQHSAVSKLSIGTSRLSYAQTVVEEKLTDVTDFERMLRGKVGAGDGMNKVGSLDRASRELGQQRSGIRSLVASMDRWSVWLGSLGKRGAHHLRIGGAGAESDQAEERL